AETGPGPDGGPDGGGVDALPDGGVTFDYAPSNFDPAAITQIGPGIDLECPSPQLDTDALDFSSWCGQPAPRTMMHPQSGAPEAVVIALGDLRVGAATTLKVFGTRAVIFAVFGNATIEGTIDASGDLARPGSGGAFGDLCNGLSGEPGEGAEGG